MNPDLARLADMIGGAIVDAERGVASRTNTDTDKLVALSALRTLTSLCGRFVRTLPIDDQHEFFDRIQL